MEMMAALPVGVFAVDREGRAFFVNAAAKRILGDRVSSVENLTDLFETFQAKNAASGAVIGRDERPLIRALAGDVASLDDMQMLVDGKPIDLRVTAVPIRNADGEVIVAVAVFEDVSRRREAELALVQLNEQLEARVAARTRALETEVETRRAAEQQLLQAKQEAERANRAKSVLLANVSHELRTPLNHILGYSDLVIDKAAASDRPDLAKHAERIRDSGRQLLRTLERIMELAKLDSGEAELSVQRFEVELFLDELDATARPMAEKNNNRFRIEKNGELGIISNDLQKMRESLLHLLENASKFTSDGQITIGARREGDSIFFDVSDSGIGMEEAQVLTIFDPFAQADASRTRKFEGLGLGLAITRRLSQLMGGSLKVKTKKGEGTTFTLRYPVEVG